MSKEFNNYPFTSVIYLSIKNELFALYCNNPIHTLHSHGRPRKIYLKTFQEKNCLNCEHLYKNPV